MTNEKKIIKELEHVRQTDFDMTEPTQNAIDNVLVLLKKQQQKIEQLEIDIDILVKDINTNNCNTCKKECEYRPRLGEPVRANCFRREGR